MPGEAGPASSAGRGRDVRDGPRELAARRRRQHRTGRKAARTDRQDPVETATVTGASRRSQRLVRCVDGDMWCMVVNPPAWISITRHRESATKLRSSGGDGIVERSRIRGEHIQQRLNEPSTAAPMRHAGETELCAVN